VNFAPPLFLVYLCALPFLVACLRPWCLLPLGLYALAVLAQTAALAAQGGLPRALAAAPLVVLTHILYGSGFWRGLFTRLRAPGQRAPGTVVLETVKELG
jgi:hypothetical protein